MTSILPAWQRVISKRRYSELGDLGIVACSAAETSLRLSALRSVHPSISVLGVQVPHAVSECAFVGATPAYLWRSGVLIEGLFFANRSFQNPRDALGRRPFSVKWRSQGGSFCVFDGAVYQLRIRRRKTVPPAVYRLHPFRLVSKGYAGHAIEESLLLNAAGIGRDHRGVLLQHYHLQVAHRLDQVYVGHLYARKLQTPPGARVQRQNHR